MNIVITPRELAYDPDAAIAAASARHDRLYGPQAKPIAGIAATERRHSKPALPRTFGNRTGNAPARPRSIAAPERPPRVSDLPVRVIIAEVATKWGVSPADITTRQRSALLIDARHNAIWRVWRDHPRLSTIALGRIFQRDHTTILSAIRRWHRLINEGLATP